MKTSRKVIALSFLFTISIWAQQLQINNNLTSQSNQADYVIISPSNYINFVQQLALFRATNSNYNVAVVNLDSIYGVFGTIPDSAIKRFISYTLTMWSDPKPEYFVLAGNVNTIPSHKEPGLYLPPYYIEDSIMVDNWYVEGVRDTAFPYRVESSIGRLPAWNAEQLQTIISKTISYETNNDTGWIGKAISVADYDTLNGEIFEYISYQYQSLLANCWKDTISVHLRFDSPSYFNRSQFFSLWNQGAAIISFVGNSNWMQFSRSKFFTTWDIDSLNNSMRLPFCLFEADQRFEKVETLAMAVKLLVTEVKGGIAVLSPSGSVFLSSTSQFKINVFQELSNNPTKPIGKVIREVKNSFGYFSEIRKQTLLGDPALIIKHPTISNVREPEPLLPASFCLYQNYPNPFNPSTTIEYDIPILTKVVIKVFNILGQEVAVLVDEIHYPGRYRCQFNGNNLSSGLYFYRIETGNGFNATKTLILLK